MLDQRSLIGVFLMLLVAGMGAFDAVLVRLLSGNVHPVMIAFTRGLFGALAMLPWMLSRPGIMKTNRHWLHALRATLKLGSLVALFAALASAPLATVTAIGFAAPLFVTVGAWIFFREAPRGTRVAGALLGFFGILVLLRPTGTEMNVALIYALISALLVGTIQLMLKHMGKTENADTLVAWNLILTVPIALIPALYFWVTPTATEWMLLGLQGVLGAFNQFMATKAFQYADASLVAPIDFVRLPFVAAAAYFFFGEVADRATWIGASLIFIAVLLIAASSRARPVVQP
ncbi:MAG: DMT family transporter [Silicimonas sp.]|nr:DMT family transporter [Silicimonas sp.]